LVKIDMQSFCTTTLGTRDPGSQILQPAKPQVLRPSAERRSPVPELNPL